MQTEIEAHPPDIAAHLAHLPTTFAHPGLRLRPHPVTGYGPDGTLGRSIQPFILTIFSLLVPEPKEKPPLPLALAPEAGRANTIMALEIIQPAGRDAHKRKLVLCRCACGQEFQARQDRVKAGKVTRCPDCRVAFSACPPLPTTPTPAPQQVCPPLPTSGVPAEARTVDYYLGELAANAAALQKMDEELADLSRLLAKEGVMADAGMDGDTAAKKYREVVTTANFARKERKRLEKELRDLSGQKVAPLNAAQSVMARARGLRGGQ